MVNIGNFANGGYTNTSTNYVWFGTNWQQTAIDNKQQLKA